MTAASGSGSEPTRVALAAPLEGRHLLVDQDRITIGILEDMEAGTARGILDALATVIVGGDLPGGTDRAGLRALRPLEFRTVVQAVFGAIEVGKAG